MDEGGARTPNDTLEASDRTNIAGLRGHLAGLDGLRFIAAMIVALKHAAYDVDLLQWLTQFHLAVDFFFMLSGFVLASAYETRLRSGGLSLRKFIELRVIRLQPLIMLAAIVALIFPLARAMIGLAGDPVMLSLAAAAAHGMMIPVATFGNDNPVYPLNGPQWSLAAEYLYSLVFGLIIVRIGIKSLIALTVFAFAGLCMVLRLHGDLGVGADMRDFHLGVLRGFFLSSPGCYCSASATAASCDR